MCGARLPTLHTSTSSQLPHSSSSTRRRALAAPTASLTAMTSMTTRQPQFNFQHTTSLVDELNRHWRDGGPSDQLSAAGVLVHILDGKGIDHVSGFANTTDGLPPAPQILWESFGRPNRAFLVVALGVHVLAMELRRRYAEYGWQLDERGIQEVNGRLEREHKQKDAKDEEASPATRHDRRERQQKRQPIEHQIERHANEALCLSFSRDWHDLAQ